jgi:HrpA-like RNA helicase
MPYQRIENILATEKKIRYYKKKNKIMETAFKNKVAIITGSSGIGRATALAFKRAKSIV